MDYGRCYNSTGSRCTGGPQPGVIALRNVVLRLYVILGSLGIYNCRPVRGGGSLSTHGEGRGWDCRCNAFDAAQRKVGDELARLLVKHARELGIQRIIWNRRQWDILSNAWRAYGGTSPHTDHLHVELCWASAAGTHKLTESYVWMVLSEEEQMTPDQELKLDKALAEIAALRASLGDAYEPGLTVQKALVKRIDTDPTAATAYDYVEHLNVVEDRLDGFEAALARIEAAVSGGGGDGS